MRFPLSVSIRLSGRDAADVEPLKAEITGIVAGLASGEQPDQRARYPKTFSFPENRSPILLHASG